MSLIKQNLTTEQTRKTEKDLSIIDQITKLGHEKGLRIIISGGYGVDGYFNEITRPHNDIDIQIYGTNEDAKILIESLISFMGQVDLKEEERKPYYRYFIAKQAGTKLDITYLQTSTSPLGIEKHIIKGNGEIDRQNFNKPILGKIGNISFEIQDPELELKDKIYKREERGDVKRLEHEHDIENLKQVLESRKTISSF